MRLMWGVQRRCWHTGLWGTDRSIGCKGKGEVSSISAPENKSRVNWQHDRLDWTKRWHFNLEKWISQHWHRARPEDWQISLLHVNEAELGCLFVASHCHTEKKRCYGERNAILLTRKTEKNCFFSKGKPKSWKQSHESQRKAKVMKTDSRNSGKTLIIWSMQLNTGK